MGIPHETNMRSLNWNVSRNSKAFIRIHRWQCFEVKKKFNAQNPTTQPSVVLEFDARLLLLLTIFEMIVINTFRWQMLNKMRRNTHT